MIKSLTPPPRSNTSDAPLRTPAELATIGMDASELGIRANAVFQECDEEIERTLDSGQTIFRQSLQAYLDELARAAAWVQVVADAKYRTANGGEYEEYQEMTQELRHG